MPEKPRYKTNNLDQYTQAGSEAFTYDRNGNLLSRSANEGSTQYSWDEDNRLIGVTRNNISISYQYDDAGRLITKKTAGAITHYLWDNMDLISEMDDLGHITQRYVYGNAIDELILSSHDGQDMWILQNAIGSVTNTLNNDGTVLGKGTFDIYGLQRDSGLTGINQGFAGMYWDRDAGLYYVRNRWYDPGLGRFLSPDYYQSIINNRYVYASNSPATNIDPTGYADFNKFVAGVQSGYKKWNSPVMRYTKSMAGNINTLVGAYSKIQANTAMEDVQVAERVLFNEEMAGASLKTANFFNNVGQVSKNFGNGLSNFNKLTGGINYAGKIWQLSQGEISKGEFRGASVEYAADLIISKIGDPFTKVVWGGGKLISHQYQDTQKLIIKTDLQNTLNDYKMKGYDNYIKMANNIGVPKSEILSYGDYNLDKGLKQQSGWAQKYFSPQSPSNQPGTPTIRISQDDIDPTRSGTKWLIPPHNDDGGGGGGLVISPQSPNSFGIGTNPPGGVDFSNIQSNSISISNDSDAEIFSYTMKTTIAKPGEKGVNIKNTMDLSAKAFFTGLTMPNSALWVNLRPDEPDRIIDKDLAKTDVGRIMLQADLDMKKDYARFENGCVYPVGAEYNNLRLQKQRDLLNNLKSKYPSEVDSINKIQFNTITGHWIGPDHIDALLDNNKIFISNLSLTITRNPTDKDAGYKSSDGSIKAGSGSDNALPLSVELKKDLDTAKQEYLRYAAEKEDLLISPLVIKEVNSAPKYADLRTIYSSIALAQWYKEKYRGTSGLFAGKIDTRDLTNLGSSIPWNFQDTYKEYVRSYNEGEFKCQVDQPQITMSNGTKFQGYYTYGVGGVVFSKIQITKVSEITPEIDQMMKEAIFQESSSSSGSEITGINGVTKDNVVYTGDSIFSVKKSPIKTKQPAIETKNTRKPLIPTQWSTTILVISGIAIFGIAILMKRKKHEDYEEDNY